MGFNSGLKELRKERILETERRSTRSHCMGKWLRKEETMDLS
jgi:hypothetical protein